MVDEEIQALKRAVAENEPGADERLVRAFERAGFVGFEPGPKRVREREKHIADERLAPFRAEYGYEPRIIAPYMECRIAYSLGGSNMWHGTTEPRGFYLHVSTEEREFRPNGSLLCTRIMLFSSGYKILVKEAARYSEKGLNLASVSPEKLAEIKAKVMRDFGDKLASEAAKKTA